MSKNLELKYKNTSYALLCEDAALYVGPCVIKLGAASRHPNTGLAVGNIQL